MPCLYEIGFGPTARHPRGHQGHPILEAIKAIQECAPSREKYDQDKMLRVWCLHHVTVIGEAAARTSDATRAQHPEVPWRAVIGMRNAIVHGYFQVDWDELWNVLARDLEPLRGAIAAMVESGVSSSGR